MGVFGLAGGNCSNKSCAVIDDIVLKSINNNELELFMTVTFQSGYLNFIGGTIKYGLNYAELRCEVENFEMPMERRSFQRPLVTDKEISREVVVEESISSSHGKSEYLSGRLGANPSVASQSGAHQGQGDNARLSRKDSFKVDVSQITAVGSKKSPCWQFEVLSGMRFLQGGLAKTLFGVGLVKDYPVSIKAFIFVIQRDIFFDLPKELDHNKSINKRSLLKLLIWNLRLKKLFDPEKSSIEVSEIGEANG